MELSLVNSKHEIELDMEECCTSSNTTGGGGGGVVDFPVYGRSDPLLAGRFIIQEFSWVPLLRSSTYRLILESTFSGLVVCPVKVDRHVVDLIGEIENGGNQLLMLFHLLGRLFRKTSPMVEATASSGQNGQPIAWGLGRIQLQFFDLSSSSTARPISCSDQRCALGAQSSFTNCSAENQCRYTLHYGDGSDTSGYYVADDMLYDIVTGNSLSSNSSARVTFGCSTSQMGDFGMFDKATDGIFGLGQHGVSVIAQLSSQGLIPHVVSHCLRGSNGGGGVLVFGQIVEPTLVYTPLVPSQPHYMVNLETIAVNGQTLAISPQVFKTTTYRGTMIDSGTALGYLAEEVYDIFVDAITKAVSQHVRAFDGLDNQCYRTTSRVDIFPVVSLNFAGGAAMVLRGEDYLIQKFSIGAETGWCMGFRKIPGGGLTILGDIVIKDKIVVYDLARQRIGWASYNCKFSGRQGFSYHKQRQCCQH
ncbi:hypothetical protein P3S67_014043 [Capsicum chacoense]